MPGGVSIVPVGDKAGLDRFIRVAMRIGAREPNYIAPLMFERGEALTAKGNPFFEHADVQFWLAVKDGRDVGRISAQIDHLNPTAKDGVGHFGMIAAEDEGILSFSAAHAVTTSRMSAYDSTMPSKPMMRCSRASSAPAAALFTS